jgi:hypothetical protein
MKVIDAKRYLSMYRDCFYIDVLRASSLHIKSISVRSEYNASYMMSKSEVPSSIPPFSVKGV